MLQTLCLAHSACDKNLLKSLGKANNKICHFNIIFVDSTSYLLLFVIFSWICPMSSNDCQTFSNYKQLLLVCIAQTVVRKLNSNHKMFVSFALLCLALLTKYWQYVNISLQIVKQNLSNCRFSGISIKKKKRNSSITKQRLQQMQVPVVVKQSKHLALYCK